MNFSLFERILGDKGDKGQVNVIVFIIQIPLIVD